MTRLLLGIVSLYQYCLSPFMTPCCRFHTTCSAYAKQALKLHGAWRGGLLTLKRLLRCRPFGGMGYDPVPKPILTAAQDDETERA